MRLRAYLRHRERPRYAEATQQCRSGIAVAIAGPRLFDHETLPAGPSWTDVTTMIRQHETNRPADIRRRAALLLFATYGFRVGEVARLKLDDLDWEHKSFACVGRSLKTCRCIH